MEELWCRTVECTVVQHSNYNFLFWPDKDNDGGILIEISSTNGDLVRPIFYPNNCYSAGHPSDSCYVFSSSPCFIFWWKCTHAVDMSYFHFIFTYLGQSASPCRGIFPPRHKRSRNSGEIKNVCQSTIRHVSHQFLKDDGSISEYKRTGEGYFCMYHLSSPFWEVTQEF